MRTCGLSHQIIGPTTVKMAKTGFMRKISPQNRTQGCCEVKLDVKLSFKLVDFTSKFGHNGLFLKIFDRK